MKFLDIWTDLEDNILCEATQSQKNIIIAICFAGLVILLLILILMGIIAGLSIASFGL